tara:strand:+ start:314 stop:673 length:360 start_codon:yes stop_codon:yes gene_type:complete
MTWKDILKEDNVDKGFAWFMPKDKPKESKKNLLSQYMSQIHSDLEKGNVIVRVKSSEPSSYNNGTLTIGEDMLQGNDPEQLLEQIKQVPELERFEVKDSSISGVPSLTITDKTAKEWNY